LMFSVLPTHGPDRFSCLSPPERKQDNHRLSGIKRDGRRSRFLEIA
jgi:hypothetical protein